jgi:hypothetical protein
MGRVPVAPGGLLVSLSGQRTTGCEVLSVQHPVGLTHGTARPRSPCPPTLAHPGGGVGRVPEWLVLGVLGVVPKPLAGSSMCRVLQVSSHFLGSPPLALHRLFLTVAGRRLPARWKGDPGRRPRGRESAWLRFRWRCGGDGLVEVMVYPGKNEKNIREEKDAPLSNLRDVDDGQKPRCGRIGVATREAPVHHPTDGRSKQAVTLRLCPPAPRPRGISLLAGKGCAQETGMCLAMAGCLINLFFALWSFLSWGSSPCPSW